MSKLANAKANNIWVLDTAGLETNNASVGLPMKSIQYAIDNGQSGDTIILNDGTYFENLLLSKKTYTIMAKNKGKAIIYPLEATSTTAPVLRIEDQGDWNVTNYSKPRNVFIGLTISGGAYSNWNNGAPAAVSISWNSNPLFESCIFTNNLAGQFVISSDQSAPEFRNCLIINNSTQSGALNIVGGQDSSRPRTKVIRFINSVFSNNNFFSTNCCGPEKSVVIFNSILSENGYNSNFNNKLFKVVGSIVVGP